MFSTIIAIRKRDDISREEFIEYYETTHIRLAQKLLPAKVLSYRRNYVIDDDPLWNRLITARNDEDLTMPAITAFTEVRFASRADAEEFVDAFTSPGVLEKILEDEARFMAPNGVWWRVVEVK